MKNTQCLLFFLKKYESIKSYNSGYNIWAFYKLNILQAAEKIYTPKTEI